MHDLTYSACVGTLFSPEAETLADRIRLAVDAGFSAVEFWGWRGQDLDAIERALHDTSAELVCIVTEPKAPLTDPSQHERFLTGVAESVEVAQRLGAGILIAQGGDQMPGVPRSAQHEAILAGLAAAADVLEGTGVTLALEPLNTRVDHPGYYLHSTREGLDLVERVDRPEIRLLYDLYHSYVMEEPFEVAVASEAAGGSDAAGVRDAAGADGGEAAAADDIAAGSGNNVVAGRTHLIAHLHLADAPGRNEPGSGTMNWRERLAWLEAQGYRGHVGLEYRPTGGTVESLADLGTLGSRG